MHIRFIYAENKRADERTLTADLLITIDLLYLLSYVGLITRSISQRGRAVTVWGCPRVRATG